MMTNSAMRTGATTSSEPSSLTFLTGGGEMAARIAGHDWAATKLGPIERWPASPATSS